MQTEAWCRIWERYCIVEWSENVLQAQTMVSFQSRGSDGRRASRVADDSQTSARENGERTVPDGVALQGRDILVLANPARGIIAKADAGTVVAGVL